MNRVLAALLIAIVTGCSGTSPSASPSPTLPAELAGRSPWQTEISNLEPDGRRSLESALTLFAMAFGPIPGVSTPTAATGTVGSASPAIRVVRELSKELTEEQRAAVDGYLAVPDDARTIEIPTAAESATASVPSALDVTGLAASLPPPFDSFEADLRQLGQHARDRAAYYFGEIPDLPDDKSALGIRTTNAPSEPFLTFFNPVFGPSGFKCDVIVNRGHPNVPMGEIARSLTLEMTHCFQSWTMGTEQGFDGNVPAWAWEGPAEYIMLESVPLQEDDFLWWSTYLLLPDISLFERSYDAVGYYAQAWEAKVDLSEAFVAVLTDVDDPERFALAGTATNTFLDKWASEHVRMARGDWGDDWQFLGPGLNTFTTQTPMQAMSVSNGSLEAYSQDAYSNHLYAVHSTADIVKVETMGRARVGDGTVDVIVRGSAIFCTTVKGCGPCPDGSDPPIDPTQLSPDFVLAVSGGTDGTNGTISGHPLEEFCKQTPPPTPEPTDDPEPGPDDEPDPDACKKNGCPMSNGDPHIVTMSRRGYDFMAAGEFVLLRNADGSFELQVRQEPFENSTHVTVNTAVAMKVGTSRVGIYADPSSNSLDVWVDGTPIDPTTPVPVGGGEVRQFLDTVEVRFPDGTRLYAFEHGFSVTVVPSEALRASAVGVMGPNAVEDFALPALPDGTLLPAVSTKDEHHQQVYGPFEDAWRVTSATSLFDYTAGTSTDTYSLPDYPVIADIRTIEDIAAEAVAAAEAFCAGLNNDTLTSQCVYDVAVTGDEGFAETYKQTATIVETGALPSTGARARVVNVYTENGQPVELDVYAWTYSDTEQREVAALVATVPYGQASEWFNPGLAQTPFSASPYTKVTIERHGEAVDQLRPLTGMSEFLGPGTVTTLAVWQEEQFDAPFAHIAAIYAEHPSYPVPRAPDGQALLIGRTVGLRVEERPPTLFASVGNGCLPSALSDPSFPSPQSIDGGNDLVVPPGDHSLTLHEEPLGALPTCETTPVGPGAPISVRAGDRVLLFAYRLPGTSEVMQLIVPFDE